MSWLKFGNLDRWSPFTRSPPQGSTTVNDADFSYITNEDLKRHVPDTQPTETETDTIILRDRKNEYTVHFPAYSIAKGELRVEAVREAAAKRMNLPPSRVKLTYKGRSLRDDRLQCRAEGLKAGVELLCSKEESEFLSDEDSVEEVEGDKKKRIRNRNKKKRGGRQDADEGLTVPDQTRGPASGVSTGTSTPLTAKEKIAKLRATLDSFDPDVQSFLRSPPSDNAKREFDRKRISETLLTQVLLKTDAIEVEGDQAARLARKELVRDVQIVLKQLDEAHGGQAA